MTDEKHSYHIFLTPILSWIFSVFPYFMGLCAHFQSIDHFSVSRLILAYLGVFIPPTGLNIGLKWTIFSSLDHWLFLVYFWSFLIQNFSRTCNLCPSYLYFNIFGKCYETFADHQWLIILIFYYFRSKSLWLLQNVFRPFLDHSLTLYATFHPFTTLIFPFRNRQ